MCSEAENFKYDEELFNHLALEVKKEREEKHSKIYSTLAETMKFLRICSDDKPLQIVTNIATREERKITGDHASANHFYVLVATPRFPAWLHSPIVSCITCMGSVHSLLLYTAVCLFLRLSWNPFEWLVMAVPCAYTAEFMWTLKRALEPKPNPIPHNK